MYALPMDKNGGHEMMEEHDIKEAAEILKKAEMIKKNKKLHKAALEHLQGEHDAIMAVPGLKIPDSMKGLNDE